MDDGSAVDGGARPPDGEGYVRHRRDDEFDDAPVDLEFKEEMLPVLAWGKSGKGYLDMTHDMMAQIRVDAAKEVAAKATDDLVRKAKSSARCSAEGFARCQRTVKTRSSIRPCPQRPRASALAPMPPSSRQRTFMKLLVLMGGLTFFARCFDQARPYWSVISGKKSGAAGASHETPREQLPAEQPRGGQPGSRPLR